MYKMTNVVFSYTWLLETYLFHIIGEEHIFQIRGDGVLCHVEINLVEHREKENRDLLCAMSITVETNTSSLLGYGQILDTIQTHSNTPTVVIGAHTKHDFTVTFELDICMISLKCIVLLKTVCVFILTSTWL